MIGTVVGLLTVVEKKHRDERLGRMFLCRCDCGAELLVPHSNLLTKNTKSCGCLKLRKNDLPFKGASRLREYQIWKHMLARCYDEKSKSYQHYGAKGVRVCDDWKVSFSAFLQDMGLRPSLEHTLDRIDTTLGYSAANCRWATMKVQQNNKRSNHLVTFQGKTMNLTQWAEHLGVNKHNLAYRVRSGWPLEKAFSSGVFDSHGRPVP